MSSRAVQSHSVPQTVRVNGAAPSRLHNGVQIHHEQL